MLSAQVEKLDRERGQLTSRLEDTDSAVAVLSSERDLLTAKLHDSNTALAEAVDQVEALVKERDTLAERKDSLLRQLAEVQTSCSANTEEAVRAAKAETEARWRQQWDSINNELDASRRQAEEERSRATELSVNIATLEQRFVEASHELSEARTEKNKRSDEVDVLSEKVALLEKRLAEHVDSLHHAKEREEAALAAKTTTEESLTALRATCASNDEELSLIRAQLQNARLSAAATADVSLSTICVGVSLSRSKVLFSRC